MADQAPLVGGQHPVAGRPREMWQGPRSCWPRLPRPGGSARAAAGENGTGDAAGKKGDPALAEVEAKLAALTPPSASACWRGWRKRRFGRKTRPRAQRLWRKALAEAREIPERVALLDLALEVGDKALIDAILDELRRQEGAEGTWWRYGEAAQAWLFPRRQPRRLEEAALRLDEVRQRRPDWSRAVLLGAQLDELKGDSQPCPGRL